MSLREKREECIPYPDPTQRPDFIESDAQAFRAVYGETATPEQAKQMLDWMIEAFGTHDLSYRPSSDRQSSFAEGRRFAGMTIIWMIKYAPTKTDPDKVAARTAGEET